MKNQNCWGNDIHRTTDAFFLLHVLLIRKERGNANTEIYLLLHNHTTIAFNLELCNDLDPRSIRQGQGHWQEKYQIGVQSISFFL